MAPKDKLKQNVQEDKKRLLLRARKWPFANILCGTAAAILGLVGYTMGGGDVTGMVFALVAASAGGATQKAFQPIEKTISAKLYEMASKIEINEQTDAKEKASAVTNSLLDEFKLIYFGGHPTWKTEKGDYGTLQVYERSVVFKNLRNRFRMPMARLNKANLDSHVQVRVRKIPDVNLPEGKKSKNPLIGKIQEFIRKKQRFVVLDYTSDTGETKYIVFWATGGNPRYAKTLQDVMDGAIRKASRDRQARAEASGSADGAEGASPGAGTTAIVPAARRNPTIVGRLPTATMSGMRGGLQEVSQDAIEAAKRASQQSQAGPSDPSLTLTTVMREAAQAKQCPYCKFSLKDPVVVCSVCSSEHHEGCWKANFGCTTKDCRGKAVKKDEGGAAPAAPAASPEAASAPAAPPAAAAASTAAATSKYQVVLASAGHNDQEREAVAAQMAQLFNIPVEKVRVVLQKVPAVAKRNLPKAEAESLAERFRNIGADASVEEMKA
jgi:hypothetical protein